MRKPAVVMLDALGTLVALESPAPRLRSELSRRLGIEVSEEQAAAALAAEIAYYRAHLDEGRNEESLASLRLRCAEALREALPGELAAGAPIHELAEALLASLHFTAFDDVVPALSALRDLGIRLLVVSNWDASLGAVLERVGIAPFLSATLSSAQVGARKPAREIFAAALRLAGVGVSEAVHVGDSYGEDVLGARSAGIEAVLVLRRVGASGLEEASVTTITSLLELPELWS